MPITKPISYDHVVVPPRVQFRVPTRMKVSMLEEMLLHRNNAT